MSPLLWGSDNTNIITDTEIMREKFHASERKAQLGRKYVSIILVYSVFFQSSSIRRICFERI